MGQILSRPEQVPLNKVHALDLQAELQREFSKREWREAIIAERKRWEAQGGRIQKCPAGAVGKRSRYIYTEA